MSIRRKYSNAEAAIIISKLKEMIEKERQADLEAKVRAVLLEELKEKTWKNRIKKYFDRKKLSMIRYFPTWKKNKNEN